MVAGRATADVAVKLQIRLVATELTALLHSWRQKELRLIFSFVMIILMIFVHFHFKNPVTLW